MLQCILCSHVMIWLTVRHYIGFYISITYSVLSYYITWYHTVLYILYHILRSYIRHHGSFTLHYCMIYNIILHWLVLCGLLLYFSILDRQAVSLHTVPIYKALYHIMLHGTTQYHNLCCNSIVRALLLYHIVSCCVLYTSIVCIVLHGILYHIAWLWSCVVPHIMS